MSNFVWRLTLTDHDGNKITSGILSRSLRKKWRKDIESGMVHTFKHNDGIRFDHRAALHLTPETGKYRGLWRFRLYGDNYSHTEDAFTREEVLDLLSNSQEDHPNG